MIFFLNHFDTGTRYSGLDIVATLNWDKLIIFAMEDGDLARQLLSDCIHVCVNFAGGAADDVVEGMPCSVVGVAEETFKQECPHPVKDYISPKLINYVIYA